MKLNETYKISVFVLILFGIFLFLISSSLALTPKFSNESIQAKEAINQIEKDILEMTSKNIPINRVNESYQEALQIYSAQIALEEKGGSADYKIVMKDALEVSLVKKNALEAKDELEVFKETFMNSEKEANLSEMQEEYNQIIVSFLKIAICS